MKKIFAIVAIVATMMISASCGSRQAKVVEEEAIEVVDSLVVAVDSVAVEAPAVEEVAE